MRAFPDSSRKCVRAGQPRTGLASPDIAAGQQADCRVPGFCLFLTLVGASWNQCIFQSVDQYVQFNERFDQGGTVSWQACSPTAAHPPCATAPAAQPPRCAGRPARASASAAPCPAHPARPAATPPAGGAPVAPWQVGVCACVHVCACVCNHVCVCIR